MVFEPNLHPEVNEYSICLIISLYTRISFSSLRKNGLDYYKRICSSLVTISNSKGQLVGNFQLSTNALRFADKEIVESSSETLRENLKHINVHKPKQKRPQSDEDFGSYLAGLIEGDGHFTNQNQLVISLHIRDIRLAYYLKSRLGFGNVYKVKNKEAVTYVISHREGVTRALNLINGKIRTIQKHDKIANNISHSIALKPLDNSPLTSNYWFAGFCDADGSFQVKILNGENRSKPEIRLCLQIDSKTPFIFYAIQHHFGGKVGHRKSQNTYYYNSTSFGVAYKLISYFTVYHLLSYKYINYLKWRKVYQLIESRQHLTLEGLQQIMRLKNSMKFQDNKQKAACRIHK